MSTQRKVKRRARKYLAKTMQFFLMKNYLHHKRDIVRKILFHTTHSLELHQKHWQPFLLLAQYHLLPELAALQNFLNVCSVFCLLVIVPPYFPFAFLLLILKNNCLPIHRLIFLFVLP